MHTEIEHDDTNEEAPADDQDLRSQVLEAVAQDPTAEIAARMIRAFQQWETAREHRKAEAKRCNDNLAGKISLFSEAMNVGHSNQNDQILKLSVVEARWQDLEDAREEKKQVAAACRDAIKACETKIKDLMAEAKSGQLNLFHSAAEAAAEGGVETDAA